MKIENKYVAILVAISIYLIFYDLIFEWIDKEIITNYLSKIKAVPRVHYTFFVLLIVITIYFVYLLKSVKHVSKWLIYTLIFATINYCYYRFYSTNYTFLSTPPIPNFKYTDLLIYITALFSVSWFVSRYFKTKEPKYNNNPFIVDTPVSKSDNDLYNRKDFAQHLAEKIQSRLPENTIGSVAMGITGKWGSGKTSFMNMIEEKLDREDRIIFRFNPWLSQSPDNIIDDFFSVMSSELKVYDKEISTDLQKYSTAITNVDENIVRKTLASIHDILTNCDNKQEYYNKINSSLLASKKQIIVFIDDLDRLDKKEVLAVLKLIRNTANFNNLFYVVCYDKQYVEHALCEISDYGTKTYLEKIFQYEFELPMPNYTLITNTLKLSITKAFKNQLTAEEIDNAINFEGDYGNFTSEFIKTPRDIVRFVNLLENDYWIIGNNINFTDFYLLSLVKLKFNKIYHDVTINSEHFFRKDNERTVLLKTSDSTKSKDDLMLLALNTKPKENDTEELIIDNYLDKHFQKNDIENKILKNLFRKLTKLKYLNPKHQPIYKNHEISLRNASKDFRAFSFWFAHKSYFTLNLLNSEFPVGEFFSGRKGDFSEFEFKIKQWLAKGYLFEIKKRLDTITDFDNYEDWQNHLKIIRYIYSKVNNENEFERTNYAVQYPFDSANIKKWEKFDIEDAKKYIYQWFQKAESPYRVESAIVSTVICHYGESQQYHIIFSKKDLYELLNSYLSTFAVEKINLNSELFNFFDILISNKKKDENNEEFNSYIIDFENQIRVLILKNLTSDMLSIFISSERQAGKNIYNFRFNLLKYFESIEKLMKLIENSTINKDNCYDEFKTFIQVYNEFNNPPLQHEPIEFDFKHLKV